MKKTIFVILAISIPFFGIQTNLFAQGKVDADVLLQLSPPISQGYAANIESSAHLSLLVFLNQNSDKKAYLDMLSQIPDITIQDLGFMPAIAIQGRFNQTLLNELANNKAVAQISNYKAAHDELDVTSQILKLAPSTVYPNVNNWWNHGYTGKHGVLAIIDTGIDPLHPALSQKNMVVRQEENSGFMNYLNGVKEPHGTGVACIYASNDEKYRGMAYDTPTIVTALSGEETGDPKAILQTLGSLDWMLLRSGVKFKVLNYSMGHGKLACQDCPDWSGLAKVMDFAINTQRILLVKSAGNMGYINPTNAQPYASTLTVPGDNYNGLTIANMNANSVENGVTVKTADRTMHLIKETSSRGPTPFGRRKPDLTAPGHDTRTCAPDPKIYNFSYTHAMDYKEGYRLMGGTSSAAPHVGASALLMQDAGITDPMAIKALLINSADTWTDEGRENFGKEMKGSLWNRTYGWGYINMEKAFNQKNNIVMGMLSPNEPILEYETQLYPGEKITLVHERRVGYSENGEPWKLSSMSIEVFNFKTHQIIDSDSSLIDTVHQVSNCIRDLQPTECVVAKNNSTHVLVRVSLHENKLFGAVSEPFAVVAERKLTPIDSYARIQK